MDTLMQDVRYALRNFVRRPGFTAIAVLSLALGIGGNTLIYGLVDGMVLHPFEYPDPDRLMSVGVNFPKISGDTTYVEALSPAEYDDIRQVRAFSSVAAFDLGNLSFGSITTSNGGVTFGLGADLNVGLMEQLAIEGRGTAHFVRPDENVERVVQLVATRLRTPLLTDVRITMDGDVRLSRMYPTGALDVFAGQDLVVLARYDGSGSANVVVRGRAAGREVRWSTLRNFPREERENAFVPRLWATQRIGWLATEKRRNGGSSEIDDEIRTLGERFGIPTEFTSYLVLEPGMVANQNRGDRRVMDGARVGSGAAASAASAAPPAARQFEAARAASEQRAAKSLAAADQALQLNAVVTTGNAAPQMKRAGTRMFRQDGGRWIDARMKDGLQVYKVKAYSTTYFTLLERIAELREAFAVGDRVLVAGKSAAIEVVQDAPELSEREIQSIVRNW